MSESRGPIDGRLDDSLRQALDHWQTVVLALDAVDDVTTEVVRLRAARHHDCHT